MNMDQQEVHAPKRIVVGVDFSEPAGYALALAATLARGAEFHVVHVSPTEVVLDPVGEGDFRLSPTPGMRERALKQLEDVCGTMTTSVQARVVAHLLFGDAVEELAGIAGSIGADLVVIGDHEHHGWHWRWHRSLAARLVRCSPCSVLTARSAEVESNTVDVQH